VVTKEDIRIAHILLLLAKEGPLNKYHIWKGLARLGLGTEPTILTSIKRIEYARCIEVKRTEKNPRGPKPSRYFDLTMLGLAELVTSLGILKLKPSDMNSLHRQLAEKYRDLIPDMFPLWPEIVKAGIEDLAQKRLLLFCRDTVTKARQHWYSRRDQAFPRFYMGPQRINGWFFLKSGPYNLFGNDDEANLKWINAVVNNDTLRATLKRVCCEKFRYSLRDFRDQTELFGSLEEMKKWEPVRQKCLDLITSVELLAQLQPIRDYTKPA
jgi:DNA-binding PadR family transcriptional regulator